MKQLGSEGTDGKKNQCGAEGMGPLAVSHGEEGRKNLEESIVMTARVTPMADIRQVTC